mgnify:CR=1 FL=1
MRLVPTEQVLVDARESLIHGHETGCPAVADDESDYECLLDAGICCCAMSPVLAAVDRLEMLMRAIEPFVDQRRCAKGPFMEGGNCIVRGDERPCKICVALQALGRL